MVRSEVFLLDSDSSPEGGRAVAAALTGLYELTTLRANVFEGTSVHDVLEHCTVRREFDAILLLATQSMRMAEMVSDALSSYFPDRPVLAVIEPQQPGEVMGLLARGVSDYLIPPFKDIELQARLGRMLRPVDCDDELTQRLKTRLGLRHFVGQSDSFRAAINNIPLIARSDGSVLIEGETGTGKEICARAIHYLSPRSSGPFVPVNCGAVPLELMENELFGHEPAAFTGAVTSQPGLIHEAEGGTLFLDEIDSLAPTAQVKMLRVLQEKEYRPLGSTKTQRADVRLVAATNTDVAQAVRDKRIREDFFYRLGVLLLRLPPLRERPGDVVLLAEHFLSKYAAQLKQPAPTLSAAAKERLFRHDWPGNVRELEHVMERAVVMARQPVVRAQDVVPPLVGEDEPQSFQEAKARVVGRFERSYVENLLAASRGNISEAARLAKKNRRSFWELIRKHQIDTSRYRSVKTHRTDSDILPLG